MNIKGPPRAGFSSSAGLARRGRNPGRCAAGGPSPLQPSHRHCASPLCGLKLGRPQSKCPRRGLGTLAARPLRRAFFCPRAFFGL